MKRKKEEGEAKSKSVKESDVARGSGKTEVSDVEGSAEANESWSGAEKTLKGKEKSGDNDKKSENQSVVRF